MFKSRKNQFLILMLGALAIFMAGVYFGFISSRSYFADQRNIHLSLNTALQSFQYASHFGRNDPNKAKLHILADMEVNLARLLVEKNHVGRETKAYICESLIVLADEEALLKEYVDQIDLPDSYPADLHGTLKELGKCRSW